MEALSSSSSSSSSSGACKVFMSGFTVIAASHSSASFSSVRIQSASWNSDLEAFEEEHEIHLPLSDGEHMVAVGHVACFETGLYESYLVLATSNSLLIGRLELNTGSSASSSSSSFHILGEVSLPRNLSGELGVVVGGGSLASVQECWLANGPTVVAVHHRQVLVASLVQRGGKQRFLLDDPSSSYSLDFEWEAYALFRSFERFLFCGDRVLCFSNSASSIADVDCSSSSSPVSRQGELISILLPSECQLENLPPLISQVEVPQELDLHLVTCATFVPKGSFLPYDLVFGTCDGYIRCCAEGSVMEKRKLEESPFQLQFAAKGYSRPAVFIVSLSGMEHKVIALSGDSLLELQAWTRVQQTVVGDLARMGYDQLLLFFNSYHPISFTRDCLVTHLELGLNSDDEHKTEMMTSVAKGLENCLQAGLEKLNAADQRRLEKIDMVESACNLMQKVSVLDEVQSEDPKKSNSHNKFLQANICLRQDTPMLYQVYQDVCFLIFDLHIDKTIPDGIHLRSPSLLLSSLHGHSDCFSACLQLSPESQRIFAWIPSYDQHLHPLHVILLAEASMDKSCPSIWDGPESQLVLCSQELEDRKPSWIYTQWLCVLDELPAISSLKICPGDLSSSLRKVCEHELSDIESSSIEKQFEALVTAVSKHLECGGQYPKHSKKLEKAWDFQEGSSISSPLSAMYSHDTVLIKDQKRITREFILQLTSPKVAVMVRTCTLLMLKELCHSNSTVSSNSSSKYLQPTCDQSFCYLLSSITHDTFQQF